MTNDIGRSHRGGSPIFPLVQLGSSWRAAQPTGRPLPSGVIPGRWRAIAFTSPYLEAIASATE